MHGFLPKAVNFHACLLSHRSSPPAPQGELMPFTVFAAMEGGKFPLEGDNGGEAALVANPDLNQTPKKLLSSH
jgi:hypothetical protein